MEDVSTFGRWGVVWIRAAERGGGACNRKPGLESDKLSKAGRRGSDKHTSGFEILRDETGGGGKEEVEISRDQKRWDGR